MPTAFQNSEEKHSNPDMEEKKLQKTLGFFIPLQNEMNLEVLFFPVGISIRMKWIIMLITSSFCFLGEFLYCT